MDLEDTNVCRVCFGPIAYRRRMNGEWLPLDCTPDPFGTVRVQGDRAVILIGVDLIEAKRRGITRYRLHRPSGGCPPWIPGAVMS
ncbi:hypothetical protein [Nocardia sp. NPDC060259]|uniref:hypothetical protein n=1 Tax=Nocardia sp. NPDC060259 TaxID=3347088 RepID=UPI00365ACFF8